MSLYILQYILKKLQKNEPWGVTGNAGKTGFYKCESVDFHIYKMWFSFCFKIEHIIYILEEKLPMIMERRL